MKKVLAFFGAFNPPTAAHLELADFARKATGREGVIFVPSQAAYIRGFQQKDAVFSDEVRLEMLETLAKTRPWMQVTGWELQQETQPRSYITLCHLREEGYEPSLLIGSDNLKALPRWKFVPEIAKEFGIVCLERGQDSCREIMENDPFLSRNCTCCCRRLQPRKALRSRSMTVSSSSLRAFGSSGFTVGKCVSSSGYTVPPRSTVPFP